MDTFIYIIRHVIPSLPGKRQPMDWGSEPAAFAKETKILQEENKILFSEWENKDIRAKKYEMNQNQQANSPEMNF